VLRVQHADEGPASIRFAPSPSAGTELVFAGVILVESGVLRVSDALGEHTLAIPVPRGRHDVRVYAISRTQATEVDVMLGQPAEPR
jgi:hypothetical protein